MVVVFSGEARSQLRAITRFIARDNVSRARSFARELREKALGIGDKPLAYPMDERLGALDIRRCIHRNYLIFYQVEQDTVRILSIVHGARDYVSLLGGTPQP